MRTRRSPASPQRTPRLAGSYCDRVEHVRTVVSHEDPGTGRLVVSFVVAAAPDWCWEAEVVDPDTDLRIVSLTVMKRELSRSWWNEGDPPPETADRVPPVLDVEDVHAILRQHVEFNHLRATKASRLTFDP